MKNSSAKTLVALSVPAVVSSASAGQLTAKIEIPQLDVAEYHRPYVAAWIESEERELIANLAVWYDTEMRDREGETWLKDLRQWWRKGGRSVDMPVDGVSGPTKPVGEHEISVDLNATDLSSKPSGSYFFVVEASREVGGRELIRIPFQWQSGNPVEASDAGERELGKVNLKIEN
ncbi:DUF2271 domain-containing protein [Pelagicoccus albus]|uniref:DUF2271 domain-containing protein n=1 Tax=Pelagicoccus albus TaxID=415222 RepID=A0A7X1B7N9_9BACT|nr:DUF2271 domain-containing protein [Pelagicoccus albus]MBC2605910.1 DUF2271 domain-containing protein [Pelagicoccus albus]